MTLLLRRSPSSPIVVYAITLNTTLPCDVLNVMIVVLAKLQPILQEMVHENQLARFQSCKGVGAW